MVKVLCVVQARITSSRFPNKVLMPIGNTNISLLEHVNSRLRESEKIDKVVFAIPDNATNDSLADFLDSKNIEYLRGSECNVLSRFYNCAITYGAEIIIRATCDNPCVDWKIADLLLEKIDDYDYVSCKDVPIGCSLEVFKASTLMNVYNEASDEISKEHVTSYIYKNPDKFKLKKYQYYIDMLPKGYRLTVDTREDKELIDIIYNNLYDGYPIPNIDIYTFLANNPQIVDINKNIKQNVI